MARKGSTITQSDAGIRHARVIVSGERATSIQVRRRNPRSSSAASMSSAALTSPPTVTARLVVDTDVASSVFKWHPEFAPRYIDRPRGCELVVSFMTVAEMRRPGCDTGAPANARRWKHTWPTFESFIRTACCAPRGPPFGTSTQKGRPISSADAWIAATALVLSVLSATNKPKDYRHLDQLQIVSAAAG